MDDAAEEFSHKSKLDQIYIGTENIRKSRVTLVSEIFECKPYKERKI